MAASRVLIPVLMCGSPTKNGLGNGNTIINHTIISYIIIFLIPWKWKDAFFSNTTWHTVATAEQEILWLIHWMFLSPKRIIIIITQEEWEECGNDPRCPTMTWSTMGSSMKHHRTSMKHHGIANYLPWKMPKKIYRARRKKPLLIQHGNGKSTIYSVFFLIQTLVDV